MNLNNQTLEVYLQNIPESEFKFGQKVDYYKRYQNLKDYLIKNVHQHVTLGANLKDSGIFLNDHGIEHINMVIRRASELVGFNNCNLSPKEVFYLLCAIQLHDVGNIFGRYQHEIKNVEIIKQASLLFADDTTEQVIIWRIAEAHGGRNYKGDKDKITELKPHKKMDSETVRTQLLAAILRFADELADDKSRAAKWPLENGLVPPQSKIYHEYSIALNSVVIDYSNHSVELDYYITDDKLSVEFDKGDRTQFLIDEIYERLVKMHLERLYCMRFMKRIIDIDKIHANIEFLSTHLDIQLKLPIVEITLSEFGYPDSPGDGIYSLCRTLVDGTVKMDGKYFLQKIAV